MSEFAEVISGKSRMVRRQTSGVTGGEGVHQDAACRAGRVTLREGNPRHRAGPADALLGYRPAALRRSRRDAGCLHRAAGGTGTDWPRTTAEAGVSEHAATSR